MYYLLTCQHKVILLCAYIYPGNLLQVRLNLRVLDCLLDYWLPGFSTLTKRKKQPNHNHAEAWLKTGGEARIYRTNLGISTA